MTVAVPSWTSVDDQNFASAVVRASLQRPVVVVMGATWCKHCGPLAEDLDAVLEHLGAAVSRTKLWIDRPGLVQGTLDAEQRAKSSVAFSFDQFGSPTGIPRTFVVSGAQIIEGFAGRPGADAFLVQFSTWLDALSQQRRSTTAVATARAMVRRRPFYRARMGLGMALPTLDTKGFGEIPNTAATSPSSN